MRRGGFGHMLTSRESSSFLRGDMRRVVVAKTEPTHCFCGRAALYRTNDGNEGRCREHKAVKGGQIR